MLYFGIPPNLRAVESGSVVNLQTAVMPVTLTWNIQPGRLYTILIYDLDAPNAIDPVNSPFIHLLHVNIQGQNVKSGDIIAPYIVPDPPLNSGLHTYVADIFMQTRAFEPIVIQTRDRFPLDWFISQYNLIKVDETRFQTQKI